MKFALLVLLIMSCATESGECPNFHFANQFNYKTNFNQTTSSGIQVDFSGQDLSLDLVDELTKEAEDCLAKNFPEGRIPADVSKRADCIVDYISLPFNRECFQVKIPNDWLWSCDGSQQLLPHEAPKELCEAKGLVPTPGCSCRWRAGLQENHIVVATPDFHLYKDPLLRLTTSCNNPWGEAKLAECANRN